jgi:hypothetical protein
MWYFHSMIAPAMVVSACMMLSAMSVIRSTRGRGMSGQNAIKPGMTTDTVVPKRQRQVDREPADSAADLGVRGGIGRCTQRTFRTLEVGT